MIVGLMNSLTTRILVYVLAASLLVNGYLYMKSRILAAEAQLPAKEESSLKEEVRTETRLKDGTVIVKVEKRDVKKQTSTPVQVRTKQAHYSISYHRDYETKSLRPKQDSVTLGVRVLESPLWIEAGHNLNKKEPTLSVGVRLEM